MNLLVTGSSGYLASLVLPRLAALPGLESLHGLDVKPPIRAPEKLRHRTGTVLDPDLAGFLRRERIDVILHLAWVFNPSHDRAAMHAVDVGGSQNVIAAAAAAGVDHVVYLSSTTAYGAWRDNPERLCETDPVRGNPDFPYSADKAEVERWLDGFLPGAPGLGFTRVRPCIILGRRADNFVRAILDLPWLPRVGGLDPALQFLHEDDLADALALLVARRPCGTYNIAPEATVRLSEIGPLLGHPVWSLPEPVLRRLIALGWGLRLFGVPASYLDFVMWPWVADVTRMREELGFTPRHTSREAVLATRRSTAGGGAEPTRAS